MLARLNIALVIPAYQPPAAFADLVRALSEAPFAAVIAVDDGSTAAHQGPFETIRALPKVHVIRHQENRGKGAALKTGIGHALAVFPDCAGIVTADADGQHRVPDILRVAAALAGQPGALILGVRHLDEAAPMRSRLGNRITRAVLRLVLGQKLTDTQTGLRGIPRALAPDLLKIPATGYEFELDMLIAAKHHGIRAVEVTVETIYLDGNRSSHFNPLRDSMRIYFVLLRFTMLSLATALVDNLVFSAAYERGASVLAAQVAARLAAVLFHYPTVRRAVFLSREPHRDTLPKYLVLAATSGALAYTLIGLLVSRSPLTVLPAKILVESALFLVNFIVQRDFVFTKRGRFTS